MKVNKLSMLCCSLIKYQPSYLLKKIYYSRRVQRDFSLDSVFLNNECTTKNSALTFTGVEHIQTLKSVSKKNNKLSEVDEKDIPIVEDLKKGNLHYPYESPMHKGKTILIEDGKIGLRKAFKFLTGVEIGKLKLDYFPRFTDILIIGGGAIGLLIAHAVRTKFPHGPNVMVVDKNNSFLHASINLGQGIVTQQLFCEEEEIPLLKYGAEFFSSFTKNTEIMGNDEFKLPYDPLGSLILASDKNAELLLKKNATLKAHGINNKIVSVGTLKEMFPWLHLKDVLFGSLGMYNEGIIDPWIFLQFIKYKCINAGVNFVTAEIIDFGDDHEIKRAICKLPDGSYNSIDFAYCVVACGIEALNIVNLFNMSESFQLGLRLPLEERMRFEYCFFTPNGPGMNVPIVVDSEGTYLRREGLLGNYVTGVPSVLFNEEECSPYQIFDSKIKPFLVDRVPQLNKFELISGWIEQYDFCFSNQVGITGPHPETSRIVFALGFSHHGFLLLPALARAVMEFLFYDDYQTIDFTSFHIENLWRKQHLEADRKKRELLEAEQRTAISE